MSRYRDRLQIVADILSIVNDRAKKTRIMYQANLSYRLLCRYLGEVVDAGLVRPEDEDWYVLTAKGVEFLGRHEKYARGCRILEERASEVNGEKIVLERMCFGSCGGGSGASRFTKNRNAKERRSQRFERARTRSGS
jgi:predicted transcriptional regulator